MILQVFSVYDSKVEAYDKPWFAPTRGAAIRGFSDALNDDKHHISAHPEDYTLFHLGEFDDQTGKITMLPTPYSLGLGLELKQE